MLHCMKHRRHYVPQWFLLGFAPMILLNGCALGPRHAPGDHAFIKYWPPAENSTGLKLAVKDNIDMKGVVTTAGSEHLAKNGVPAAEDAPALAIARQRGVTIVGKTNLSELAVAPSGMNEYFGTPKNPFSKGTKLVPGGSSSGSAVAVATGRADVAFGTDTAGSVRVPAACCGIVGLKTTHGLIPIKGVYPIEPEHLDTIGPLARNIADTVRGMDLLQHGFASQYAAAKGNQPSASNLRIGRLTLPGTDPKIDAAVDRALAEAGFQVVLLGDSLKEKWEHAKKDGNTIAAAGAWISNRQYQGKPGISTRTGAAILAGQIAYNTGYREAIARQKAWQETLRDIFRSVDFIALPTLQTVPPSVPVNFRIGIMEARMLNLQNTVAVNFAGNPALAMPIPIDRGNIPVTSLQLIGPRRSEAALLNAGRLVENAVKKG